MTTGLLLKCTAALLGFYIMAFTAFYLVELAPHMVGFESLEEAGLYLDTISSTYPRALQDGIRQSIIDLIPSA